MNALQKAKVLLDQASKNGYIYSDDLGCYVQPAEDAITNVFIPFNSAEELAELLKEREEV